MWQVAVWQCCNVGTVWCAKYEILFETVSQRNLLIARQLAEREREREFKVHGKCCGVQNQLQTALRFFQHNLWWQIAAANCKMLFPQENAPHE